MGCHCWVAFKCGFVPRVHSSNTRSRIGYLHKNHPSESLDSKPSTTKDSSPRVAIWRQTACRCLSLRSLPRMASYVAPSNRTSKEVVTSLLLNAHGPPSTMQHRGSQKRCIERSGPWCAQHQIQGFHPPTDGQKEAGPAMRDDKSVEPLAASPANP